MNFIFSENQIKNYNVVTSFRERSIKPKISMKIQITIKREIAINRQISVQSTFNCTFKRTISDISNFLQPIEDVMRNGFNPAITGGHQCSNEDRALLGLPIRLGMLGLESVNMNQQER